jgi:hypothetical protein
LVRSDKEVERLQLEVLDAEFYKKNCQSVCQTLLIKKDALKGCISLYSGELFCLPKLRDDQGAEFLKKQKENSKRSVRKEIKRKLRKQKGE